MFADYVFGVSRLQGRFAHRPVLGDEHRNERVPEYVMREVEPLREFCPPFLKVCHNDGELLERISPEPRGEVRMDGYPAGFADF